jgi:phosphatidylinositol kinase/protein kinase (PI-3  family)
MFVLQLINIMNQLWILNNHDLNVLTFNCLQTGDKRGFIEMVTEAETLKEIQGSAINAFRKSIINGWLKSHNPQPQNFLKAVDNFTNSCAAYSVATYVLGIGDRHNDNVMVKYSGHMFHIDFGKYLGDAQMFAGIYKRDRSPMLFTQDMFYVINQGTETTGRFQEFIDKCCKAFQILRQNYNLILSLMEMVSLKSLLRKKSAFFCCFV